MRDKAMEAKASRVQQEEIGRQLFRKRERGVTGVGKVRQNRAKTCMHHKRLTCPDTFFDTQCKGRVGRAEKMQGKMG